MEKKERKRVIGEVTKEDLNNFCNKHNRLPNNAGNYEEVRLYQFFRYHRGEPDIEELRDRLKKKKTSEEALLSISKFCKKHGRMPYYSKHSKEERNLYMIWYNNRNEPEYIKLKEKYTLDKEKSVISFCENYGRLPKCNKNDSVEKSLYNYWNRNMRDNPKFLEFNKKYYHKKEKISKEDVIAFIKNNNILPRWKGGEEGRLRYFLEQHKEDRNISKAINELPEKYKLLNESYTNRIYLTVKDFKVFCDNSGRLPLCKENTKSSEDIKEHRMYRFMIRHKNKPEVKEIIEKFTKIKNKKHILINFFNLHIDDLAFMDKTQLIHIALLDNLPKDDYKKIIDCPKGEARKEVIKSIVDGLKNSEEETETFEEFLEEETEKQNTDAKEETEFEKSLHTGIDITEKPGLFDQKKSIEDVFMEIESLDNLDQGGYIEQEAVDYITCSEIQKLWNAAIYNPGNAMKLVEEYASTKGSSKFFNAIICEFLKQYKEVCDMKLPEGYSFPYQPLLMQKLTAYMVKERSQFANWSETGTGKTLSGVLASRCIDSRLTLVIAVNSTVNNWTENSIRVAYPDSKVYQKKDISDSTVLDRNFHNYVVVNYEEFQNSSKFLNKWKPFVENNIVDFVILDEIQKVKSKGSDNVSKRRAVIENLLQTIDIKHGRDLEKEGRVVPVLALSATPVINTLNEGLSILSLLKGTDFISRRRTTRRFALDCHFEMVKTGLRLVEESPARERLITFPIKRSNKDILEINKTNGNLLVNVAVSNCLLKLGECIRNGYLQTGTPTLVYTELVTDVIDNAMLYLQGYGFKVGEFTGRNENTREKVLEDFIAGKYDVLLASKPITTGVDGLQNVCNRIIPIDLPWTYAEYHQLTGRCNRKGTKFDEVTIIIPTVEYINDEGEIWSLDNSKLARIKYKQTLADVIMTGEIPDNIITKEEAFRLAKERLLEFINSDKKDQEVTKEIPVKATEIKEVEEPKTRIRGDRDQRDYFSEFQGLNQRISTSTCNGVFSKIIKSNEDWVKYHDLREKAMGNIQDQPIQTIARDFLKSKKHKILGDMGCGMNRLKTLLPDNYEVISVDMYAADNTVKICNLIDTSKIIPDESLDIAVYCLSLWSRNWREILKDAYRILDYDGKIIIVEPINSSSKNIDKMKQALSNSGFINISTIKDGGDKFYYMTASK